MYLGLDLSTQQIKGLVVSDKLEALAHVTVEFDKDFPQYKTVKGVYSNSETNEVQAPVAMWLEAVDLLFERLKAKIDLSSLKGVSGACQQHGSVFWKKGALQALQSLDSTKPLKQLETSLSWDLSPNWQDHSTAKECDEFESAVGGMDELAKISGSKAHHRFTGPQILKLKHKRPDLYEQTEHISLVSSFLASVLAGDMMPLDIGDVCGMNLWDIQKRQWNEKLLSLLGDEKEVIEKLGPVSQSPKDKNGQKSVSSYFSKKYGVSPDCKVVPFTGDNPGTIMSLPLEANDVIVSLGTSTTALVVTEKYVPSPQYHLFSHPAGRGYMGMLCYCNGALAREQVRDEINKRHGTPEDLWGNFDKLVAECKSKSNAVLDKVGFYFPLSEIIPDCPQVIQRYQWSNGQAEPVKSWANEDEDALRIIESQALSIRARLGPMLTSATRLPRKLYFVGGGSKNKAICEAFAKVLFPSEGAFTLDLTDACAKGAANLAAFGASGTDQEWEKYVLQFWDEKERCSSVHCSGADEYGQAAVDLFFSSEKLLLQSVNKV
uniref:Xylulose kinase n=1 Tax=Blastobotrys adeninivorans TaxID=409370 RepID=A0A060SZK7_BLAAD